MDLKQPLTVIQVIKKKLTYGKNLRAFDVRSKAVRWPDSMQSFNGSVNKNGLFLTPELEEHKNFSQSKCLLLLDEIAVNTEQSEPAHTLTFETGSSALLLSENKHLVKWDVFAFQFQENSLHTFFEWDYFKVGLPERENYKLFNLSKPKVLSLQVNGKIDSTLTVGTRRYYQEMEYYFIYHGQFTSFAYQTGVVQKQLTYTPDKKIDLLKRLY